MAAQMLGPMVVGTGIPLFHAVLGPLADGIGIPPGPPGDVSPQPVPDFQLRQIQAKGRETPPLATDRVADPPIFLIASHLDCLEHPAGPPRFLLVSPHDGAVDLGPCGQQVLARACLRALRRFLPKSRNAARHYTIHALNPFTLYHRVSLYTVFAIGVLLAIQSAKAKGNRQVPSHQFPPLSADSSLVCGARPEPSG